MLVMWHGFACDFCLACFGFQTRENKQTDFELMESFCMHDGFQSVLHLGLHEPQRSRP